MLINREFIFIPGDSPVYNVHTDDSNEQLMLEVRGGSVLLRGAVAHYGVQCGIQLDPPGSNHFVPVHILLRLYHFWILLRRGSGEFIRLVCFTLAVYSKFVF